MSLKKHVRHVSFFKHAEHVSLKRKKKLLNFFWTRLEWTILCPYKKKIKHSMAHQFDGPYHVGSWALMDRGLTGCAVPLAIFMHVK